MTKQNTKTWKRLILLFSALYFYIFLLFYVPNYVLSESGITLDGPWLDVYLTVRKLSEKLVCGFVPVCAGALLFIDAPSHTRGFLGALITSLPSAVYSLPYCYLYALSLGFDSIWGTVISLCFTVLGVAATFCHISLAYLVASVAARIALWKKIKERLDPSERRIGSRDDLRRAVAILDEELPSWKFKGEMFEFDSPAVLALFAVSCAEFAVKLIIEIVDTISFLSTVGATFTPNEIVSILLSYLVLLAELLIYYELCCIIRKKFNKGAVDSTAKGV